MKKSDNLYNFLLLQTLRKVSACILTIQFLFPSIGLSFQAYISTSDNADFSVKEENGQNVISNNSSSGRISIVTGSAMKSLVRRLAKPPVAKTCENSDVVSIRDSSNTLLGTATHVSASFYLTARHVLAGKDPFHIKTKDEQFLPIRDIFKKYFQIKNKKTGKPLDILLVSSESVLDEDSINKQLGSLLNGSPVSSGAKWSSCQFAVHEQNNIFSQYSEGEVKLTSDDQFHFFLGINQLTAQNGVKASDLTTFGSSGASVWIEKSEAPSLAGVVSCLQIFQDPVSGVKSYFPKILSVSKIFNSEEFYFEETSLEDLLIQPQESDPHCPFTDGKGAGGFFTGKDLADNLMSKRTDTLLNQRGNFQNQALEYSKQIFNEQKNPYVENLIIKEIQQK